MTQPQQSGNEAPSRVIEHERRHASNLGRGADGGERRSAAHGDAEHRPRRSQGSPGISTTVTGRSRRLAAITIAGAALLLCAALAPIQSRIWNGDDTPAWIAVLAGAMVPSSSALGQAASAMPQPPQAYFTFGRPFTAVYLLLLAATWLAPPLRPRWSRRVLLALLAVAACGNYTAYWLSESFGPGLRAVGFWRIEVPALAAILLLSSVAGIRSRAAAKVPRAVAWSFALCVPLAVVATTLIRYMPHAPLLPFAVATVMNAVLTPSPRWSESVAHRSRARRVARGVTAVVVIVLLGVAWWLPYRPVIVKGDAPSAGPFAALPAVAGLRLHVFNTGANRMSPLLVGANHPWRPAPAFVLEHPTQGLIVFDAGLSEAVARDGESALGFPMSWLFESRGRSGRTLDAQMREVGLDPARVRWVIVSHLHVDHTGAAPAFTNATFVGGAGASAHPLEDGFAPKWREIDFAGATPLPPFDEAVDLFGDGSVRLLRGGGHTEEDLMALLAMPYGPVLLAGDAVVHREWLADDDVQRIAVDPARAARVRNQVRALLAASPATLFPGHDLSGLPSRADVTLHHPEWFAVEAWPIEE